MHFTKMRGGSQDKGHEYSGRGPKVLCFGRLTSKQMYKVRELPSLLADNQLPFPVNACADAGMQPPVNQNRRGLLRIPLIPAEKRIPSDQQLAARRNSHLGVHGRAPDGGKINFLYTLGVNHSASAMTKAGRKSTPMACSRRKSSGLVAGPVLAAQRTRLKPNRLRSGRKDRK